jgi:hypothetical protein
MLLQMVGRAQEHGRTIPLAELQRPLMLLQIENSPESALVTLPGGPAKAGSRDAPFIQSHRLELAHTVLSLSQRELNKECQRVRR